MAVLRDAQTGRRVSLGARCLVGRSRWASLWIEHDRVSSEHASLHYEPAQGWLVRDLASRNGTWVDGTRLEAATARVTLGALLCFGHSEVEWQLVDDTPPGPSARRLSDDRLVKSCEDLLYLPSEDLAHGCVLFDGSRWHLESKEGQLPVEDQMVVELQGELWHLELPPQGSEVASTTAVSLNSEAQNVRLEFRVSRDEEHVQLTLCKGSTRFDLGERSHHYLLLTLARRRLEDEQRGVASLEQGWTYSDDLSRMLATSVENVNLLIWRARGQLKQVDVAGAQVLERRRGQVRLGPVEVDVGERPAC